MCNSSKILSSIGSWAMTDCLEVSETLFMEHNSVEQDMMWAVSELLDIVL